MSCPECGGDTEVRNPRFAGNEASCEYVCMDCGEKWLYTYENTGSKKL